MELIMVNHASKFDYGWSVKPAINAWNFHWTSNPWSTTIYPNIYHSITINQPLIIAMAGNPCILPPWLHGWRWTIRCPHVVSVSPDVMVAEGPESAEAMRGFAIKLWFNDRVNDRVNDRGYVFLFPLRQRSVWLSSGGHVGGRYLQS